MLFPLDYAVVGAAGAGQNGAPARCGVERIELRPVHDLGATPGDGYLRGIVRNSPTTRAWRPCGAHQRRSIMRASLRHAFEAACGER